MNIVTFVGTWSSAEKMIVYRGIITVGRVFSKLMGVSTREAYTLIYEGLSFGFTYRSYYDAVASEDVILCKRKKLKVKTLVHELGHVLALRLNPGGPMYTLTREGIYTKSDDSKPGKFLTGSTKYGYYYRNNGIPFPKWYKTDAQVHPLTMPDSDCASEDWADMFTAYILDLFRPTSDGRTVQEWVRDHLTIWLLEYKEKRYEDRDALVR